MSRPLGVSRTRRPVTHGARETQQDARPRALQSRPHGRQTTAQKQAGLLCPHKTLFTAGGLGPQDADADPKRPHPGGCSANLGTTFAGSARGPLARPLSPAALPCPQVQSLRAGAASRRCRHHRRLGATPPSETCIGCGVTKCAGHRGGPWREAARGAWPRPVLALTLSARLPRQALQAPGKALWTPIQSMQPRLADACGAHLLTQEVGRLQGTNQTPTQQLDSAYLSMTSMSRKHSTVPLHQQCASALWGALAPGHGRSRH